MAAPKQNKPAGRKSAPSKQGASKPKAKNASAKKPFAKGGTKPIEKKKLQRTSSAKPANARSAKPASTRPAHTSKPLSSKEKKALITNSPCPVDHLCGGCKNIATPYSDQLVAKNKYMHTLMQDAGLYRKDSVLRPILGMDDPFCYRNKVASPFARGPKVKQAGAKDKGRRAKLDCQVLTGMYQTGTHKLVPTDDCLIENEDAHEVIKTIKSLMVRFNIQPYDEDAGTGFIRHAVVRVGHESGEMLVTVVTNAREFPGSKQFCRELVKKCPLVTTVVQNVNTRQTNVILGEEEHVLYGPGFILDTLCGLSFRISSQSFYQVSADQTQVLYNTAIKLARLTGEETVIDAYCGTGTIGLVAAAHGAKRVIGVDSVDSSIRDARQNAQHNGVENAQFVTGDAGLAMRAWAGQEIDGDVTRAAAEALQDQPIDPANTVLMMDPPRAGSDEAFLGATCTLMPARIVYISCNPETQMRDMRYLINHGYELKTVQPVDMFPHTDHVESVAVLEKR